MQRSHLLPGTYILNNGPKREGGRFQAGDHEEMKRILSTVPGVQVTDKATRADYVILPPHVSGPGSKLLKRGSRFRNPNTWVRMEDVYMINRPPTESRFRVNTGPVVKLAQAYGEPEPSVPSALQPNAEYSRFLNPDYYRQLAEVKDIVTEPAVPSLKRPVKVPIGNEAQTEAWAPPTVMAQATIDRHVNKIDQLLERVPGVVRPKLPPPLEPVEVKVKEEKIPLIPERREIKEEQEESSATQVLEPTTKDTVQSFFGENFRVEYEQRLISVADALDDYLLPDEGAPDDNTDQILDADPDVLYRILNGLQNIARLLLKLVPEHRFSTEVPVDIPEYSSQILKRLIELNMSTDVNGFLNQVWTVLHLYVAHYYPIYQRRRDKYWQELKDTHLTLTCQTLSDLCVQSEPKRDTLKTLFDLDSVPHGVLATDVLNLLWQRACDVFSNISQVTDSKTYNTCVANMADAMDVFNYFADTNLTLVNDMNTFCHTMIVKLNETVGNPQVSDSMKDMNLMGLLVYLRKTGGLEGWLGLEKFMFSSAPAGRKLTFQGLQLAYGQDNKVNNFYALFVVSMIFVLAQTCNLLSAEQLQVAFRGTQNVETTQQPDASEQTTYRSYDCIVS